MDVYSKLLDRCPGALPAYELGRCVVQRQNWMENARTTPYPEVREQCVRGAREANHRLVRALQTLAGISRKAEAELLMMLPRRARLGRNSTGIHR